MIMGFVHIPYDLGIVTQVLQDPVVRSNLPLYRYVSNIKEQGTKKALGLKTSINPSSNRYGEV